MSNNERIIIAGPQAIELMQNVMNPPRRHWRPHERFKRWLMRKNRNELANTVGDCAWTEASPLARFLRVKLRAKEVCIPWGVQAVITTKDGHKVHANLPPWAQMFEARSRTHHAQGRMTVHEALVILQDIEKPLTYDI